MQLFVRIYAGKTITIECSEYDTISCVKQIIANKIGIPYDRQRLTWNGILLDDNRTVESYGIPKESTIHLGGGLYFYIHGK